jgi:hypothetical protein
VFDPLLERILSMTTDLRRKKVYAHYQHLIYVAATFNIGQVARQLHAQRYRWIKCAARELEAGRLWNGVDCRVHLVMSPVASLQRGDGCRQQVRPQFPAS